MVILDPMPNVWREEITRFGIRQFANPWHDEIGRFAPKGTGSTGGFKDTVKQKFDKFVDSWLGPDGFDQDALQGWVDDMRRTVRESGEDLDRSAGVPVVSEIPAESNLKGGEMRPLVKSSEVDDFYEEAVRVLNESLVGLHDQPPRIRDMVKEWFRKLVDTGPAETRPVFPWLS
jgi:hypothetical protein